MRIDLPQCNLKTCRYQADGNCTDVNKIAGCEYAYALCEVEQLKAKLEQSVKLPCKVKDVLYGIILGEISEYEVFAIHIGMTQHGNTCAIWTHNYRNASIAYELIDFGKTIFLTREEAERALKGGAE